MSPRVCLVLLAAAVAMSCSPAGERRLVGFPGMPAAEFNRLNKPLGIAVDPTQPDWKGLNAPHRLVLEKDGRSLAIPVLASGGGTHIKSTGGDYQIPPPRIQALAFDIGPSYSKLEESAPRYHRYCRTFERWAEVAAQKLPSARTLETALSRDPGPLREAVVCTGEGPRIAYSIVVQHFDGHRNGGDYSLAGADGYIGLRVDQFVRP